MLPDGYKWRPYCNGPALYLSGRMIAMVTVLPASNTRVTTQVDRIGMSHYFLSSEAAGVSFVERWANKWDARLREQYSRPRAVCIEDCQRRNSPAADEVGA
jgi:hypothetical protein